VYKITRVCHTDGVKGLNKIAEGGGGPFHVPVGVEHASPRRTLQGR
jgi:hypothetical protein